MSRAKLMMVTAYSHGLIQNSEVQRTGEAVGEEPDLVWVFDRRLHPVLGDCWVGSFVESFVGMINVHFPAEHARLCTPEERERLMGGKVKSTFAPSYRFYPEDFEPLVLPEPVPAPLNRPESSGPGEEVHRGL